MAFNFGLNNLLTYRDRRLRGWMWIKGLVSFMVASRIGALSNVGISMYLFSRRTRWVLAALAGVLLGVVSNRIAKIRNRVGVGPRRCCHPRGLGHTSP